VEERAGRKKTTQLFIDPREGWETRFARKKRERSRQLEVRIREKNKGTEQKEGNGTSRKPESKEVRRSSGNRECLERKGSDNLWSSLSAAAWKT